MQLYVDKKREKSEALIRKIEDLGRLKAIFVTVDAAAPGKREADERGKAEIEVVSPGIGLKFNSEELVLDHLTYIRSYLALCPTGRLRESREARFSPTVKAVELAVRSEGSSTRN
jgi:hypothetical protein